jgi:hypothetical protein
MDQLLKRAVETCAAYDEPTVASMHVEPYKEKLGVHADLGGDHTPAAVAALLRSHIPFILEMLVHGGHRRPSFIDVEIEPAMKSTVAFPLGKVAVRFSDLDTGKEHRFRLDNEKGEALTETFVPRGAA